MKLVQQAFACVELPHRVMGAQQHLHVMPPITNAYVAQQGSIQPDVQLQGKHVLQGFACVELQHLVI